MPKYAYCPAVIEVKGAEWILAPFIKAGAKKFNSVDEIPNDYILISVHHPPWRSPLKEWLQKGNNYIEIDYGYWGLNIPRRNSRRITYNGSHNIKKNKVPFSRINTLIPNIEPWKQNRGTSLLLIEPQPKILQERLGISFSEWQKQFIENLSNYWDGPYKWRRKAGGKNAGRWPSFLEDLKNSHAVLGERTMACVEAVMLGYPAYTTDISTVSLLMGNDLSKLRNPDFPDRTEWLEHVAWSQFYTEEFNDGLKVLDLFERYQINS